jgi:hypothetical protein
MAFLKIMPGAAKFCDHHIFSLIAHAAKIVARILWSRFERKFDGVLGEDQFRFRKKKGTKDAYGMLRVISERTWDRGGQLRLCFLEWQKKFKSVNWTKLRQVINGAGIDFQILRLIEILFIDQRI